LFYPALQPLLNFSGEADFLPFYPYFGSADSFGRSSLTGVGLAMLALERLRFF
jgi:hypothetical protein